MCTQQQGSREASAPAGLGGLLFWLGQLPAAWVSEHTHRGPEAGGDDVAPHLGLGGPWACGHGHSVRERFFAGVVCARAWWAIVCVCECVKECRNALFVKENGLQGRTVTHSVILVIGSYARGSNKSVPASPQPQKQPQNNTMLRQLLSSALPQGISFCRHAPSTARPIAATVARLPPRTPATHASYSSGAGSSDAVPPSNLPSTRSAGAGMQRHAPPKTALTVCLPLLPACLPTRRGVELRGVRC